MKNRMTIAAVSAALAIGLSGLAPSEADGGIGCHSAPQSKQLVAKVLVQNRTDFKAQCEARVIATTLTGGTVTRKQRFSLQDGKDRSTEFVFPVSKLGAQNTARVEVWQRLARPFPLRGSTWTLDQSATLVLTNAQPTSLTLTALPAPPTLTVASTATSTQPLTVRRGTSGVVTPLRFRLKADKKSGHEVTGAVVRIKAQGGEPDAPSFTEVCLIRRWDSVVVAGPIEVKMVGPYEGMVNFEFRPLVQDEDSDVEYFVSAGVPSSASLSTQQFSVEPTTVENDTSSVITVRPVNPHFSRTKVIVDLVVGPPITIIQ